MVKFAKIKTGKLLNINIMKKHSRQIAIGFLVGIPFWIAFGIILTLFKL